ncbi:hypothetical protein KTS45_02060 [Halomicroarcula limicola]|uniref:Uncharacterized protein n=1 Tax=Haloarcula limicola TaxID=1429915 RepID=A0A8J7Y915_9EURY|nr:hypothetical protein [Halomicroarcula limicola]MBV0922971.1 hypothetical protein [Halomicroarcula limicola]
MPTQTDEVSVSADEDDQRPTVTAHGSGPEKTVFTENGNREGWIATDLTVECWR